VAELGLADNVLSQYRSEYSDGALHMEIPNTSANTGIHECVEKLSFPAPSMSKALFAAATHFSQRYDYPLPRNSAGVRSAAPEISCIIVVNENYLFVRERMLSTISYSSRHNELEIIIVQNGYNKPADSFWPDYVTVTNMDTASVARAYNRGVAKAKAPIVALFHDDCLLDDENWLKKVKTAFSAGAQAVSPEFRTLSSVCGEAIKPLPVLKNVPLVLPRDIFNSVGGYDERLFIGYEDMEFTIRLIESGFRAARISLSYRHFGGMSSCLKFCPTLHMPQLFASLAVPSKQILFAVRAVMRKDSKPSRLLSALTAMQLEKVLSTHSKRVVCSSKSVESLLEELRTTADATLANEDITDPHTIDQEIVRLIQLENP